MVVMVAVALSVLETSVAATVAAERMLWHIDVDVLTRLPTATMAKAAWPLLAQLMRR